MSQTPAVPAKRSAIDTFLNIVERGGNLLPHPATLFAILAVLVVVASGIAAQFDLVVQHPSTGADVRPVNLMSIEGLHRILGGLVTNFTSFAPLGTVLVALIGIGVAEHSGLIGASLRLLVLNSPRMLLTPILVFAGVMSNMASEIGYVLLVPLAGLIFISAGRHPILGMAAAFAGVSGGYSANLLIGTIDPLLSGLSQEAARIVDPNYTVSPLANWYFMAVSTPVITLLGWFVTEKIIAPRFPDPAPNLPTNAAAGNDAESDAKLKSEHEAEGEGDFKVETKTEAELEATASLEDEARLESEFESDLQAETETEAQAEDEAENVHRDQALKPEERRGLIAALLAVGILSALLVWGCLHPDALPGAGFLRIADEPDLMKALAPLLHGVVAIIFLYGVVAGIAYGAFAGTIKSDNDVIKGMSASMATLGSYLVLVFFAAQFVAFFNWTQLGLIIAVEGARSLQSTGLSAVPLFIGFILLTAFLNLFMGSASAKWALMAPVFVPMFMLLGYSPELTQVAYRVGDSVTNIISPMMSYFALIIAFLQRYEPKAGIGTVVSVMLPYSIVFLIGWSAMFAIWLAFGLPIGPDAPLNYVPAAAAALP